MRRSSHSGRFGSRALAAFFVATLAVAFTAPRASVAQDTSTLARLLRDADDFRVRVQAAFALGNAHDPSARPALEHALEDRNEAVRAAAATALGRLGLPASLPALRRAARDASSAVRTAAERATAAIEQASGGTTASARPASLDWSRVRAVVLLGAMSDRSGFDGSVLASALRSEVSSQLSRFGTLAYFSGLDASTREQVTRRHLPLVRVDGNVMRVSAQERNLQLAVRCEVSLTLVDEPGGNLRGMMQGAATGLEDRVPNARDQRIRLAQQALAGAVRSAMSSAETAIVRATQR